MTGPRQRETGRRFPIGYDRWLAYMTAPMWPLAQRLRVPREAPRGHNPNDILVP